MARNRGCCRRAKSALTRDCSPVRLPNWVEGYLQGNRQPVIGRPSPRLSKCSWLSPAPGALGPEKRQEQLQRTAGNCLQITFC